MRNFRRAVLGDWFIQVIPCNQSQIWGFHDVESDELLHLSTSGYFRDVWRKNLPLEKVFWNIVISLMRNSQSDVLGGWFIHLIGCNQIRMWCFHDNDSYRAPNSEHVRLLQGCLEKESTRRNSFLKHRNQSITWEISEELPLKADSFSWLLVIRVQCEVFMMRILTGPLHLCISRSFSNVWRQNIPGEKFFWNITISLRRNFRRAVLGGWFIQMISCNQSQMWGVHHDDSD